MMGLVYLINRPKILFKLCSFNQAKPELICERLYSFIAPLRTYTRLKHGRCCTVLTKLSRLSVHAPYVRLTWDKDCMIFTCILKNIFENHVHFKHVSA
jgi:hypothetical protein